MNNRKRVWRRLWAAIKALFSSRLTEEDKADLQQW
jgi:hypothetical protein